MKLIVHFFLTCVLLIFAIPVMAQTTVLDFETPETSTTFQYFGSSIDGSLSTVIDNPDPTGANTSNQVLRFVKPAGAQVWAGAFSNPDPNQLIDFSVNGRICIKAWMPRPGNISLKFENSVNGGDNWIQTVTTDEANSWVELCYDPSLPSIEGPFTAAAGFVYTRLVIFAYFGEVGGAADEEVYLDDFILEPNVSETVILDFEAAATTTNFQYFGSAIDGQLANIISNPDASGINPSATVLEFKKPGDAQVWAGAFSNPPPTIPVNATNGGQVCIKVWSATAGNLALKLENSPTGANWIQTQTFTATSEWTEVCYDLTLPSIEGPFEPAAGIYATVVLFFDFGTAGGGVEKTYYLDDVVLRAAGSSAANIKFSVNAGAGAGDVFLMGTFNDWTPAPMTDVGNGIYTMDMELENGVYEYKYLRGAEAEEFSGLDECTVTTPDGEFTNRRLIVSGDEELDVVCFNSCYDCGQAVQITVNLGFSGVEPAESGVYLAGGLAFGAPGGRFLMTDPDGDGVYSISFERGIGFSSYYAFANGNCPDYSCKEDISGQDCANPGNFNDRLMSPVQGDLVINTCFAVCSDNVECTTSTSEQAELLDGFDLHPTIVNDRVSLVRGSLFAGEVVLRVSDLHGRVVQQQIMAAFEQRKELDFSMLKSGMYLLSMKADGGFKSLKFVKM